MRLRIVAAVVTPVLVWSTLVATPRADAEPDTPSPRGSATEVTVDRQAVRFRAGLGLPTDAARMREAAASRNESRRIFGVPLTDDEHRELVRRQQVIEDDASRIRSAVKGDFGDDVLAGVWMDNRAGGKLTVAVTEQETPVRAALGRLVKHPDRLVVRKARWSMADLTALGERIAARAERDDVALSGMAVDERGNELRVLASDGVSDVRAWLSGWLPEGARVRVEQSTAAPVGTPYVNSPPFRGGQGISGGGYTCTSAFIARATTQYFMVSAGHCGPTGVTWYQGDTVYVGSTDRIDISGTDALRIPISSAEASNQVILWYSPALPTEQRVRSITSSQSAGSDTVGQVSCITGQNFSDLRCGEILSRSFGVSLKTHWGATLSYTNGREVDADCNPGDSGGSALYGNQARGIISVKVTRTWANDTCVYAHIDHALASLGLSDVVTTPGPYTII